MNDTSEYHYLVDFFLDKRKHVDGNETPFTFTLSEVVSERSPIKTRVRLLEILKVLEIDRVIIGYEKETVITKHEPDNPSDTDAITIHGSSTEKFKLYKQGKVKKNHPDSITIEATPLSLPPNTKWGDIAIKFKDGHDIDVILSHNGETSTIPLNYATMGFQDSRTRRPNKQWKFLIYLSEHHCALSWDDSQAHSKCKKRKQNLSKQLKDFFDIAEDPFHSYRKEKRYEIKIHLIPIGASSEDRTVSEPIRIESRVSLPIGVTEAQQQENEDELDPEVGEFLSEYAPLMPE